MAASDWNWRYPCELQDYPWDCSAASLAWALNAYGHATTEQTVIAGLGPTRITPVYGLSDATGAGLVEYLGELGIPAANNPLASWEDVCDAAGSQPMVIGGRTWCHWVGVRMRSPRDSYGESRYLYLANPAPGYANVGQFLTEGDFEELGDFSAVWFPAG